MAAGTMVQTSVYPAKSAPRPDGGSQLAFEAHQLGALDAAVAGYQAVIATLPQHVDAWANICIALEPELALAHISLGNVRRTAGAPGAAFYSLQKDAVPKALGHPVWLLLPHAPEWRLATRARRQSVVSDHAAVSPDAAGRLGRCVSGAYWKRSPLSK